eukprot:3672674-Rhodomonas_salina.2
MDRAEAPSQEGSCMLTVDGARDCPMTKRLNWGCGFRQRKSSFGPITEPTPSSQFVLLQTTLPERDFWVGCQTQCWIPSHASNLLQMLLNSRQMSEIV